jgi:hypothetical protein
MSWPARLAVAVLTGMTAMFVAGFVASLAVDWYQVSSFEGKSGYFLVGMALLGLLAGVVIGLVVSRVAAAGAAPSLLRALGTGQLVVVGLAVLVGGGARAAADVPPRLDAQPLLLAVELRWPAGQDPRGSASGEATLVHLGATRGRTVRASRTGPLWREDARLEEGRWIVPGAVELFTSRGGRLLHTSPARVPDTGFVVPLPGRPGREFLEWSGWLPHGADVGGGFSYRFRIVPENQPIRTEHVGPFEIATVAQAFGQSTAAGGAPTWWAAASFTISHRGAAISVDDPGSGAAVDHLNAVAVVAGTRPALVVLAGGFGIGTCVLLSEGTDATLHSEPIGSCAGMAGEFAPHPEAAAEPRPAAAPPGHVDRQRFALPGVYLFADVVLDTRTLTLRRFSAEHASGWLMHVPPLGASPDGRSLARIGHGTGGELAVHVVDVEVDVAYTLPVDPQRTGGAELQRVDPVWLLQHFEWRTRGDGRYELAAR